MNALCWAEELVGDGIAAAPKGTAGPGARSTGSSSIALQQFDRMPHACQRVRSQTRAKSSKDGSGLGVTPATKRWARTLLASRIADAVVATCFCKRHTIQ